MAILEPAMISFSFENNVENDFEHPTCLRRYDLYENPGNDHNKYYMFRAHQFFVVKLWPNERNT